MIFVIFAWYLPAFILILFKIKKVEKEITPRDLLLAFFVGIIGWIAVAVVIFDWLMTSLHNDKFWDKKLF